MSGHLRIHRKFKPHTLYWNSKNICSLSASALAVANFAALDKRMGKTWGVLCKGVQYLMMGEVEQIEISSLKIIDLYIFAFGIIQRSFVKP